uniref:Putative ovule protein n=1 Tax=Solanum chacoense TaxID=4108 RepID=A0A0V0GIB6_SOLCH
MIPPRHHFWDRAKYGLLNWRYSRLGSPAMKGIPLSIGILVSTNFFRFEGKCNPNTWPLHLKERRSI